ncbi:MAG: DUF5305 family protein [Natronomonas sp.]
MIDTPILRLKYLFGQYWRVLVPALMLISAMAFAGAAAGMVSEQESQQRAVETDSMTVDTTLSTRAAVTGNTTLYEQGETLTDMPVYLQSATPEVTLVAATTTPADRTVSVTQQIILELSATRNGEVFWRDTQTLAIDTEEITNGTIRTEVALDVQQLAREELAEVTTEAGDIGTIEAEITAETVYETGTYSGRTQASTPVSITDRAYELDTPQTDRQSNTTTVIQTVPVTESTIGIPGMSLTVPERTIGVVGASLTVSGSTVGGAVAGLTSLAFAIVVWLVARRIEDFEAFREHYTEVRYAEWISRGKIPETGSYIRVPVEALVDVVDIAIDSQKRVIHDPSRDVYAVVDDNHLYEFRKDAGPGWMNEFGFPQISEMNAVQDQDLTPPEDHDRAT